MRKCLDCNKELQDVDMICTESQLKLWKGYSSMQEYLDFCHQNGYTFLQANANLQKISTQPHRS